MNTQTGMTDLPQKNCPITIIGQDMHIMNPGFIQAVENRDGKSLAAMAASQVQAGATALDLNLGTSRKTRKQTAWAVETIQNAVQVPLFISAHVLAQAELLRKYNKTITINSVTAEPTALSTAMHTARDADIRLVVLLVRPGLTPYTVDERLQLAAEVLDIADKTDFPVDNLFLDPLFHLRPDPLTWQLSRGIPDIDSVLETLKMLPELAGNGLRTLVSLSSASQFLPAGERPALHCRLLPLLVAAGIDAVIVNCRDHRLMDIARNPEETEADTLPSITPDEGHDFQAAFPW